MIVLASSGAIGAQALIILFTSAVQTCSVFPVRLNARASTVVHKPQGHKLACSRRKKHNNILTKPIKLRVKKHTEIEY